MIQRELRFIITFHTTEDALAMECACKNAAVAGRLIPVPAQIHAGCGLAWSAEPGNRDNLQDLMMQNGIRAQEILECLV